MNHKDLSKEEYQRMLNADAQRRYREKQSLAGKTLFNAYIEPKWKPVLVNIINTLKDK